MNTVASLRILALPKSVSELFGLQVLYLYGLSLQSTVWKAMYEIVSL